MSGPGKTSDHNSESTQTSEGAETKQTSSQQTSSPQSIYPTSGQEQVTQPNVNGAKAGISQAPLLVNTPNPQDQTGVNQTNNKHDTENDAPLLNQSAQVDSAPSFSAQPNLDEGLKPRIVVIGVGGAGCNAINNMIKSELVGVDFFVANTDAQALEQSDAEIKIQLGLEATHGLGAGSHPEMGRASAEESIRDVLERVGGSHMLFVTAGMGGGTGTGAAPVIAKAAREHGILTVGVVTKPFHFEGAKRMRVAEAGIEELQKYVDTLIVIPNQNLFRVANEKTTFVDAFKMADEVLYSGVRSVTDLMMKPGLINLDFADVKAVMGEMMGKAMMGTGEATGEGRAIDAAEAAISSPLLDDVSMKGAKAVLINITGGMDMTLFEADEAANRIREEVDPNAHIIFGSTFDESLEGKIRVSCVATGIDAHSVVAASVSQSSSRSERNEALDRQISAEAQPTQRSSLEADSASKEDSFTSPHVSSVEQELGISFDEELPVKDNGESTYDIYSSLRKDINLPDQNEGPAQQPTQQTPSFEQPDFNQQDQAETEEPALLRSSSPEPAPIRENPQPTEPTFHEQDTDSEEHRSFFSRLMGRKKNSPKANQTPQRKLGVPPQSSDFRKSSGTNVADQDELDVPAFLRRKDRH